MPDPERREPDGQRTIMPADVPPFREFFNRYREREGLSVLRIAKLLGLHHSTVLLWSQGRNPEAKYAIAFARLAGLDERVVLAAAGHWPPDLPITDPGALDLPETDDLLAAAREVRAARPDIPAQEFAALLRYWALLPDDQRELLFELIQRYGSRVRREEGAGPS